MEVAINPNNTNLFPNSLTLHIYKSILLFIWSLKSILKVVKSCHHKRSVAIHRHFVGRKQIDYQNSNWTKLDFCWTFKMKNFSIVSIKIATYIYKY